MSKFMSFREWFFSEDGFSFDYMRKGRERRGGRRRDIEADVRSSGLGTSAMEFETRVARGKGVEEKIKKALRDLGHNIEDATVQEDMYDKIDAYWDGEPVQIKYRDTGDDILFELIKPFDSTMPLASQQKGKDFRSKAKYFVVLSRDGKRITKIPIAYIRLLMNQMMRQLGDKLLDRPFRYQGIELRPVRDPRDGTPKVNAFIPPAVFQGIGQTIPVRIAA